MTSIAATSSTSTSAIPAAPNPSENNNGEWLTGSEADKFLSSQKAQARSQGLRPDYISGKQRFYSRSKLKQYKLGNPVQPFSVPIRLISLKHAALRLEISEEKVQKHFTSVLSYKDHKFFKNEDIENEFKRKNSFTDATSATAVSPINKKRTDTAPSISSADLATLPLITVPNFPAANAETATTSTAAIPIDKDAAFSKNPTANTDSTEDFDVLLEDLFPISEGQSTVAVAPLPTSKTSKETSKKRRNSSNDNGKENASKKRRTNVAYPSSTISAPLPSAKICYTLLEVTRIFDVDANQIKEGKLQADFKSYQTLFFYEDTIIKFKNKEKESNKKETIPVIPLYSALSILKYSEKERRDELKKIAVFQTKSQLYFRRGDVIKLALESTDATLAGEKSITTTSTSTLATSHPSEENAKKRFFTAGEVQTLFGEEYEEVLRNGLKPNYTVGLAKFYSKNRILKYACGSSSKSTEGIPVSSSPPSPSSQPANYGMATTSTAATFAPLPLPPLPPLEAIHAPLPLPPLPSESDQADQTDSLGIGNIPLSCPSPILFTAINDSAAAQTNPLLSWDEPLPEKDPLEALLDEASESLNVDLPVEEK